MTAVTGGTARRTGWHQLAYLARRAWWMEIRGYQSIYRFVFRRPRVPPGAVGFPYAQPVLAILIVFLSVSALELVVVDLIVRRWAYVRIALLILSIWGLVWMLGLLFGMITRPHSVGPEGIRVRYGGEVDVPLGWEDVASVAIRRRSVQDRQPAITVDDRGEASWHLRVMQETNLELELERPTTIRLPQGTETVRRVAFYAEDPSGFLAEVRRRIG